MDMNRLIKLIVTVALMAFFAASCSKSDEPNNGGNVGENDSIINNGDTLFGHDFVDLGLPSGTLWATCNVGADNPEDCGDYFAWGETCSKELYDWKNYRYGNCVHNWFAMTKYCTNSDWGLNGFVDSLTVLEPAGDAATANWGDDWRMPTKEEWEELYLKTTSVWTTRNGVEGRLLTGPNGNSIFLPATGFCLDGEPVCPRLGIYWSCTLHSRFPERGWSFHYDMDECHVCGTYERSRGQIIRAVRVVK